MNSVSPHRFSPELAVHSPRLMHRHAAAGVIYVVFLVLSFRSWGLFASGIAVALAIYGLYRWHDYRRYGARGKPLAALRGDMLFFSSPGNFKPFFEIPLAELETVVIYGLVGERRFRFMGKDGRHREFQPSLGRELEASVIQFITTALTSKVKVSVKEPPSFFERTRGDDGL